MELTKAREIRLTRKYEQIVAVFSVDLNAECKAVGATVQDALLNLASEIDRLKISVWFPAPAKQYVDDDRLKAACPEMRRYSRDERFLADSFVCDECGAGVDVDSECGSGG